MVDYILPKYRRFFLANCTANYSNLLLKLFSLFHSTNLYEITSVFLLTELKWPWMLPGEDTDGVSLTQEHRTGLGFALYHIWAYVTPFLLLTVNGSPGSSVSLEADNNEECHCWYVSHRHFDIPQTIITSDCFSLLFLFQAAL